jgi:hypothetical protein
MATLEEIEATKEAVAKRFFTATNGQPPTSEQKSNVAVLIQHVVELAAAIEHYVPVGRNKSLALTALEDVQMRANRGIFAPEGNK